MKTEKARAQPKNGVHKVNESPNSNNGNKSCSLTSISIPPTPTIPKPVFTNNQIHT